MYEQLQSCRAAHCRPGQAKTAAAAAAAVATATQQCIVAHDCSRP
jgi:hypothetical protein